MTLRARLPQVDGGTFITDGGMETTLIFDDGFELPCFAAFVLLDDEEGPAALQTYLERYVAIAREHDVGLLLDAPTWRASAHWGAQLGYSPDALADVNRRAVALVEEVRARAGDGAPIVVSGAIGPRDDAYRIGGMSPDDSRRYHLPQLETLAATTADMATGLTLTTASEAIGIVRAAGEVGLPVAVSFTLETDGRLPDGQSLDNAIAQVDEETEGAAAYFMINCAHPTHFEHALGHERIRERLRGVRANASARSHAELDESETLDAGDPALLAGDYLRLKRALPNVNVIGGCCGTDHRHVAAILRCVDSRRMRRT